MRVIFNVQDVSEYVAYMLQSVAENAIDAQKGAYKKARKKDHNALFYYGGDAKVKKVCP